MLIALAEHLKPVRALSRPQKGIVVDNVDPDKLGRVKVTIDGLLEGAPDVLPWVSTLYDPSKFDAPEINDELYIIFPFNSIYFPFSLGYFHSESNHNPDFDDDYPNTFGVSKQGFILKYNKTQKVGDIIHPSGTTGQVKEDGTLVFNIAKDMQLTLEGKFEATATGDIMFTTEGDLKQTAMGKIEVEGTGGLEFKTDAMAKFSGTGGTEIGDASSPTMVNGSVVLLAGGGVPVAVITSVSIGPGNLGAPVVNTIIQGSSKVLASP